MLRLLRTSRVMARISSFLFNGIALLRYHDLTSRTDDVKEDSGALIAEKVTNIVILQKAWHKLMFSGV